MANERPHSVPAVGYIGKPKVITITVEFDANVRFDGIKYCSRNAFVEPQTRYVANGRFTHKNFIGVLNPHFFDSKATFGAFKRRPRMF